MTTNQAFIDGQNLYMATAADGWRVDLYKFRRFLADKYQIRTAYYFIGAYEQKQHRIYQSIRHAGFKLVFRAHSDVMTGAKKGNVDTDIVFSIMSKLIEDQSLGQVVLVSGDGDYFRMVEYLIKKGRLRKILAPCRASISSLYDLLPDDSIKFLNSVKTKSKIQHK